MLLAEEPVVGVEEAEPVAPEAADLRGTIPSVEFYDHNAGLDMFSIPVGDPMVDLYQHAGFIAAPVQVAQHFSSLSIATSPSGAAQLASSQAPLTVKSCSVCGRVESKTCKIGHRLQNCKERSHTDCRLVCNSCEDFFRRHSGAVNIKERCEAPSRDPASCLGGKTSRHCQLHRYQRCLEVGMQPLSIRETKDAKLAASPPQRAVDPVPAGPVVSPLAAALSPALSGVPSLSAPPVVAGAAAGAKAAPAPMMMGVAAAASLPLLPKQALPAWDRSVNVYNRPEARWRAFCASLNLSNSLDVPAIGIEEFLAQKIEYSDLIRKYSGEAASAIWHERGSVRMCVESFFTFVPSGLSPAELREGAAIAFDIPTCVHVDYVAQRPIHLGRDLVPISVPATLPVPPKAYLAYRSSIPNLVAIIERKEKTTTPPFAAESVAGRPLSVAFSLTSKLNSSSKTWLYLRRRGEEAHIIVPADQPMELSDGDTLSIWNEHSDVAELIAWRVCVPQASH